MPIAISYIALIF
jgi:hypothetical protein